MLAMNRLRGVKTQIIESVVSIVEDVERLESWVILSTSKLQQLFYTKIFESHTSGIHELER